MLCFSTTTTSGLGLHHTQPPTHSSRFSKRFRQIVSFGNYSSMVSIANVRQSQPVNTTKEQAVVGKKIVNTRVIPMPVDKINSLTCAREQYVQSSFAFCHTPILSLSHTFAFNSQRSNPVVLQYTHSSQPTVLNSMKAVNDAVKEEDEKIKRSYENNCKVSWNEKEDEILRNAVESHALTSENRDWHEIARTVQKIYPVGPLQRSERWNKVLKPD